MPKSPIFARIRRRQEHVRRLHITVHDPLTVCRGEPARDVRSDGDRARRFEASRTFELVFERRPFDELHHQIGTLVVLSGVVDRDHVRRVHLRERPSLP